ncbi:MAG TPA: tetratricopeptide repeat protein, partial [Pyrinomonadaceae bacterium]|nr:tetratricopeptide repeat protein [Pyrinomonadaceae bacterium]
MFRSRAFYGQLLLIYLLLPGFSKPALSQTKPSGNINLSHIETSIDRGKLQEVETPLIDYAIAHPNDARALELLGKLRYRQHRLEEAQSLYQRVLVLNPSLTRAKINLGRLTYELGQREQARRLLAEIDITSAVKLDDRLALAKALVLTGEFQKGLAVAESLPISVRNGAALPLRVAIFIGLGQRQRLVDLAPSIRRAAVSNPELAAEFAEVFQAAGMFREAGDLLRLALPRAPNNFRLLVLLGQIEVHLGNLVDARRHLNRAVKLEPNEATSLFAFGLLESAERNYEAALSNFKQAHALASDST